MDKEYLIKFLKENLKVDIWCDCGCENCAIFFDSNALIL